MQRYGMRSFGNLAVFDDSASSISMELSANSHQNVGNLMPTGGVVYESFDGPPEASHEHLSQQK
ncbi:uncharacterized protein UV8b_01479 [Ustilaginoidea virens]|uniref:Uncharacterized protein n=1 Tax=Ustilaginoidea virens TaxID=1159556 RepID=A0A8E5MEG0_USTVR|nr:uncharacterized protein UV8b_01479 [Ustilaginoidea virens]QUC17238.1 hypothetical protein UV8b_01479 [Ustilaginoidea virens]